MQDSEKILRQLEPKIVVSPNNSATPAGQAEENLEKKEEDNEKKKRLIETINECFELLRINYQHLYFSAYSEMAAVNAAKRLWLESLACFPLGIIRQATHNVIKESDFLPTISRIIKECNALNHGEDLPDAHSAYVEACNASSPKQNYDWSHPAVYHAGRQCSWYFLASNNEKNAFPIFKAHYEKMIEKINQGHALDPVKTISLPEKIETPLSKEENAARLATLRQTVQL